MSSVNSDSFVLRFQFWMPFISYLIAMARTSNTMLNISDESSHLSLVPAIRGKAFSCILLSIILVVGFSCMAFIMWRYSPSKPALLKVFIMNGCYILSNAFFLHLLR